MRAITAPELVKLRSDGQWSRLYLAGLEAPPVVFAARVNQAFAEDDDKDNVLQVTYDTVTTGAYTDIIAGMTLWIGSAAGLHDIGMARIRKTPTSAILYLGTNSEIDWDDNLYLTVVDEFSLWPRHARVVSGVTYMDGEEVYSDQHDDFDPIPVMGSDAVLDVDAYPVVLQLDGSDSWVPGGTITDYLWTKTAGTLSSSTAADPTLTVSSYPSNGLIRYALRVTASNGKTFTGYRYVRVYDSTHRPQAAQIASIEGNFDTGGWSFEATMYDDASDVRDRSPIILFARDYYGGVLGSIGQQEGRENIVMQGWVDGETIEYDSESGLVRFTVKGPQFWLDKMPGFPPVIAEQRTSSGSWNTIPSLTVDRALWHLLHWHSTATMVMDVLLTGDTRYADKFDVPTQSLWMQIKEIAEKKIQAVPGCDRFGRLFVEIEPQYVQEAARTWVEVMTITAADWRDSIIFKRRLVGELAMLDLSSVDISAPNAAPKPYYSLSVGHAFARFGGIESMENLLASSQSQSNRMAGLVVGRRNNPWPSFEIKMAANNRMIDLFPHQYYPLTIATGDTPRGKAFDGRLIPRVISMEWDADNGVLLPTVTLEAESFEANNVDGEPPANNPIPPMPPPPSPPPAPPPGGGGTTEDGPPFAAVSTWNFGLLYTLNFDEDDPDWFLWNGGLTASQSIGASSAAPPIRQLIRDPNTGYFYLLVLDYSDAAYGGEPRGGTHLFVSSGPGAAWTQLLYAGNIPGVTDPSTEYPRIISVGVSSGGAVMAIGGAVGDMRIMLGDAGGLEHVTTVPTGLDASKRMGALVYSLGKWLLLHAEDNIFKSRAWSLLQAGGGIDTDTSNDFGTVPESASDRAHWAILLGETVLYWTYGNNLIWIADNDPTAATYSAGLLTGESAVIVNQCIIAADPGGTHLMGGGSTTIGQRSSDGGASWGNVGTAGGMSTGYRVWGNGGDANQFVAATSQKVMLTLDWGDNWVDRSGNLPYLAPLCSPNHIFAWY